MKLPDICRNIKRTVSLVRPSQNNISPSNKGVRAFLYGKDNGDSLRFGLIHLVTASRFRNEISMFQNSLRTFNGSESAATKITSIQSAVPEKYRNAFYELLDFEDCINIPIVERFANVAETMRKKYDFSIANPMAKIKRNLYFGLSSVKSQAISLFRKSKTSDVDFDFAKQILPSYVKIPEGLSKEQLKEFIVDLLKKCNYSDKEIKSVFERKCPVFYRFVDQTELRAVKNGSKMTSAASYNVDFGQTDITTDPNYRGVIHEYRITFKPKDDWNPFSENGRQLVEHNDITKKTWSLLGGYDRNDILCVERVY